MKPSSKTLAQLTLWRTALYQHYTAPQAVQFKSLRNGFIAFAFGLGLVLGSNSSIEPSTKQEALVLIGLAIGGAGFVLAMKAYIRILISRIVLFLTKP